MYLPVNGEQSIGEGVDAVTEHQAYGKRRLQRKHPSSANTKHPSSENTMHLRSVHNTHLSSATTMPL